MSPYIAAAIIGVLILLWWAASNVGGVAAGQLHGSWVAAGNEAILFVPAGGNEMSYEASPNAPPQIVSATMRPTFWSKVAVAWGGADQVNVSFSGNHLVIGGGEVARGSLELAAGRLTLFDKKGATLAAFFRNPSGAAKAYEVLSDEI